MRLVFQRPQYAARDRGDVGVTAPARHREPIWYLHQVALRLVIGFDLAVSAQQAGTVLAQLSERPASLVWRTLVIVRTDRCPAFGAIILAPAQLTMVAAEPALVGGMPEGNADMTLGLQALGFVIALADADRAAGHGVRRVSIRPGRPRAATGPDKTTHLLHRELALLGKLQGARAQTSV